MSYWKLRILSFEAQLHQAGHHILPFTIHEYMDDVMERLGRELILSENGDVSNAVGAITSKVSISRNARVAATSAGGFRIQGLEGENRHYESLEEAEECSIEALITLTRTHGRKAGTSASDGKGVRPLL